EQTPTKVFFPNINASAAEYAGLGLTEREFKLVRQQIEPGSRRFLVKQGTHSVVCQLDLAGFDSELSVISGRLSEGRRMEQVIAAHGREPAAWLPMFTGALPAQHGQQPADTGDRR